MSFVNGDLRKFCITSKFDLAVNLFTSFGYFETDDENFSLFSTAYELLNDGGYFVIDYFNADYLRYNLIPHSEAVVSEERIIQERKIVGNRVVKDIIIKKNGIRKNFRESVRMYAVSELRERLEESGFRVLSMYGDFDGSNFDLNSSPRIIIILRK